MRRRFSVLLDQYLRQGDNQVTVVESKEIPMLLAHILRIGSFVVGGTLMMAGAAGAQTPAPANAPTFTKDVAPIFQEKCEACHRPDSIAPMSLVTYAETRPWARS